jgi:putative FmdB family regulatory protein
MPIYEYECQSCSHRFEEWQKISDPPVNECPKCHANKIEKLISQTSFQLKGGGWYSDLYASNKRAPASSNGTASESKSPAPAATPPTEGANKPQSSSSTSTTTTS